MTRVTLASRGRTHPGRAAAAVVAALAALLLTGCTATVTTDFEVTSATAATVHVGAVFTDEAADMLAANASARAELVGVFTDRTGTSPEVVAGAHRLELRSTVSYDQLARSGALLGVSSAKLSGADSDVTLTLQLAKPTALADAVQSATKTQPDSAALAETMLRTTTVTVNVTFPGGVAHVSDPSATVDGDTVTLSRTVAAAQAGTLEVTGDPHPARWPYYGGGAALVAVAALTWRRWRR